MKGIYFNVSGHWAQFRKPETNNTPLTHDFMTKTAMVGLIGAVLGLERREMRALYPQLCEDILFGIQVLGVVKKVSWAFTLRNVHKQNDKDGKAPRQMEFIKEPSYLVTLGLLSDRSRDIFDRFAWALENQEARFTPVLGLHNCPAELTWGQAVSLKRSDGPYLTKGFAMANHRFQGGIDAGARIGFDRVPTYQDAAWWNPSDKYVEVIYAANGGELKMDGEHYITEGGDAWCLI
jgi:CRISPR-associated Cas5-like protein